MKITVIVPSEKSLANAGVRVRYRRIVAPLAELGTALDVVPIDTISRASADNSDVYIFSKCQDARALVLAAAARRAGITVGVDLFDDYFSQENDARFAGQRGWLREMARQAAFFLCSTPRMLAVAESYFEPGRGHVLNDPYEGFDAARLEIELATKIRKAKRERNIPILWFGIGGNPNFPVGLSDLSAFGEALRPFQTKSYRASVTILTNRNCIDGLSLERLRRLPVPFVIREWSEEREKVALSRSLVSFLPVNFQQFSVAKSLNRGISALVGGTQLLAAGYPLYEPLRDFAYHDAARLIDDLENSTLRLSGETVAKLAAWIGSEADAAAEASSLIAFLAPRLAASEPAGDPDQIDVLLHGAKTTNAINHFAQRLDWLTLATPLLPGGAKTDAHLGSFGSDPGLRLRVSKKGLEHLPEELRAGAMWADTSLGQGPDWDVPLSPADLNFEFEALASLLGSGTCGDAPVKQEILRLSRRFFARVFPGLQTIESELEPVANVMRAFERN